MQSAWRTYERSRQTKSGSRSTRRRAKCQIKRLTTKRSAAIGGVAHASVARLIISATHQQRLSASRWSRWRTSSSDRTTGCGFGRRGGQSWRPRSSDETKGFRREPFGIDERATRGSSRPQFTQKSKLLRRKFHRHETDSGHVATGPVEAGDEAFPDRVAPGGSGVRSN